MRCVSWNVNGLRACMKKGFGDWVKAENFSYDSLPDEVNIRLIKDSSEFCFPMKNVITSPYGWRWNRAHRGVDIQCSSMKSKQLLAAFIHSSFLPYILQR